VALRTPAATRPAGARPLGLSPSPSGGPGVTVPTTAILRGAQGIYVFAVGPDNKVKIHNVTLAETTGNTTGILSGLNPGDVVVTDGQDKLQDGTKVEPRSSTGGAPGGNKSASSNNSNSPFASPAGGPAR